MRNAFLMVPRNPLTLQDWTIASQVFHSVSTLIIHLKRNFSQPVHVVSRLSAESAH